MVRAYESSWTSVKLFSRRPEGERAAGPPRAPAALTAPSGAPAARLARQMLRVSWTFPKQTGRKAFPCACGPDSRTEWGQRGAAGRTRPLLKCSQTDGRPASLLFAFRYDGHRSGPLDLPVCLSCPGIPLFRQASLGPFPRIFHPSPAPQGAGHGRPKYKPGWIAHPPFGTSCSLAMQSWSSRPVARWRISNQSNPAPLSPRLSTSPTSSTFARSLAASLISSPI